MMTVVSSTDGNYLIVGVRSVGMFLYSITGLNLELIEKIPGDHLSTRMIFTKNNDDSFLLISTGVSLVVYERSEPNYNKDFPSFFNSF